MGAALTHLAFFSHCSWLVLSCAAISCCLPACAPPDSVSPRDDEHIGQVSSALISPTSLNIPIAHTFNHETSVAYVRGAGAQCTGGCSPGRWIAVANNQDISAGNNKWSWMVSTDGNGSSWTIKNQFSGTEFGSPPGNSPSNGSTFTGWAGDPSIAAVTDPTWSNGGRRVVGVSLAATTQSTPADVIIALSDDGGQTWGNLQWVDTGAANGDDTDMPFVFSNPQAPYDTYVSWVSTNNGARVGHLRKVKYDLQSPPNFIPGSVLDIPKAPTDPGSINRFNFGFATLPSACTSGAEGIFIVYTNQVTQRCFQDGTQFDNGNTYWNLTVYDTGNGHWYNPWTFASVPHFKSCVALPLQYAYTNTQDPHIAVDPSTADVWVSHTTQAFETSPVRVEVDYGRFQCGGGGDPVRLTPWFTSGDPCPGCGADDAWLPAIAMHHAANGTSRVGVYWYSTTQDNTNTKAALYAVYQENLGGLEGPYLLASGSFPIQGGATSWTVNGLKLDPWDYQTLGTSWDNRSFLSAWAGDLRAASVPGWNGGFETGSFSGFGPLGWDWAPVGAVQTVTSAQKHSGSYSALLGSASPTNGDSTITQNFYPPQSSSSVSVWYNVHCPDTVWFDWATATLKDNVTSTECTLLAPTCVPNSGWLQSSLCAVDPTHSYTIKLTNHDDNYSADPTYTYFDDVTFAGSSSTVRIVSNVAQ